LKILPETLFRVGFGFQKVVYAQEKFPEVATVEEGFRGNFQIHRWLTE
jgi:hypothetical protein